MDFRHSARSLELAGQLQEFMNSHVYPAEAVYAEQRSSAADPHVLPDVVQQLKIEARSRGLWNLFLPAESGLSNLDYAPLAEITGRSIAIAPEAINCSAPDTGNMEVLHMFGSPEQKERWLAPLLDGEIRSCFAMTEPDVASSDATNIASTIARDGDDYVINGRKWWTTGAADPRCAVAIFMGKTDPSGPRHAQQSMVLVPLDTPGVEVVRSLPVFGYSDQQGHCEVRFTDVRVPVTNLIGQEGGGFAIAQARLGPGRIHHCMRAIGMAERAVELMARRVQQRVAFGRPLAEQGVIREWIALSRIEIEQARLLVLKTAWLIDTSGARGAATEIAAIKVAVPRMALAVLDRAIQAHGGGGVCDDFPLAQMWAMTRTLRLADGPDEVHLRSIARAELSRWPA
ncbi:MAG TPA: acyl-CoA dehydrogenase family protein [Mycobacteriales bacterium]|nr:acyl-CoA dehydrogenase family protein [Mycobacteriales bacterium]